MEKRKGSPVLTWLFTLILLLIILPLPASAIGQPGEPPVFGPPDTAVIQQPLPDLVPLISAPREVRPGESVEVTVTVQNRGGAAAPGSVNPDGSTNPDGYYVDLVLSQDPEIPYSLAVQPVYAGQTAEDFVEDMLLLGGRISRTASIPPGGEVRYTLKVLIPAKAPPGLYCLGAVADPASRLVETDKRNNIYCHQMRIGCPLGCECLTEGEANKRFGSYERCTERFCGYEDTGFVRLPKYCFRPAAPKCPEGCTCLPKTEGSQKGFALCQDEKGNPIRCGVTTGVYGVTGAVYQEYNYCFRSVGQECYYDYEKRDCVGTCPPGQTCRLKLTAIDPETGKVLYGECACEGLTLPREVIFRIGERRYTADGQKREMDVAPFIRNGRTYTPVRYLAYALGLSDREIAWDPAARRVRLTRGPICVELVIGQPVITVNGTPREMDVVPLIVQGRTFLPARYVGEAFSAAVAWNEETRTVRVGSAVEQPLNQTAEYEAFATGLAAKGYRLNWEKRVQKSYPIGGQAVEIVCIPSETVNGAHAELIIARNAEGELFAQAVTAPGPFDPTTWALSPDTLEKIQGLLAPASAVTPEYCTQPGNCIDDKVLQCISNPGQCLFRWLKGAGWPSEGKTTVNLPFNTDVRYKLAGKLLAWKIYKAMTGYTTNHPTSVSRIGHSGAYSRLTVTHDSLGGYGEAQKFARFLLHGFRLRGKHGVNFNPAGHNRWEGTGRFGVTPVKLWAGTQNWLFKEAGGSYITTSSSADEETFDDLPLEIDWSMDYNPDTGILTVEYGAKAEASFGLYDICKVSLYGKGGQKSSVQLDGSDVQFSFDLFKEAGVKAECGFCPCAHAEIGGGAGLVIEITNPDPCNVVISLKFYYGWGGHGDALNIKRETCDNREVPGPVYTYNVCEDQNVQNTLKSQGLIKGANPAEEIEKLLDQYQLPGDLSPMFRQPLPKHRPAKTLW